MTQGCREPGIATVPGGLSIQEHSLPFGKLLHEPLRAARAVEHCLRGLKMHKHLLSAFCVHARGLTGARRSDYVQLTLQCRRQTENHDGMDSSNDRMWS